MRERFQSRVTLPDSQAQQLYDDVLKPQVIQLRAKMRAAQEASRRRSIVKTTIAAGVMVAIGSFCGVLPQKLAEWAGTVAGVNLAREVAESAVATVETPEDTKADPMYFLLQVSNEIMKQSS